jgi:uncharacterized protein (TIGR03083 family)
MADNEAAHAGGWTERGRAATAALAETWDSLAEVCHELSGTEWALPTECPGWDVKDQLSHLIGIERMIMGESTPEWDGPLGDHVKGDFAAMNEKWVAVRRGESGPAVQAEFVEVTRARLDQLGRHSAEEWAAVGASPLGQMPQAEFMDLRVYDSWVHEQDVRRALDRPGGGGGRASAIALDRVQSAMGFVVGKRAATPDGHVVRFEISGPGADARVFDLAVAGGRATPSGDAGPPTVTLALSSVDFVRLGCGRVTAGEVEAAAGIGVEGDPVVAKQILDHMNFMF